MKKKVLSLLLTISMVAALAAGCGTDTSNASNTENQDAESRDRDVEAEKITMYLPTGSNVTDLQMVTDAINEISVAEINTEIEIKTFDFGQWFQQYSLFLSGTEDVDILVNYGDYSNAVSQGAALDITDLIQQYGQDIIAVEGDYLKSGEINGTQYAIPVYAAYANTMGILYRADIVKELGLEEQVAAVKTLDDWTEVLTAVKESYPDMTPFVTLTGNMASNFTYGTWDSLGNNYGVLMNGGESSDVINLFETEEYANLCSTMHEWYVNGYTSKDIQTQTDTFVTLTQNDAAFSTLGSADFNAEYYSSTTTGKEIGAINLSEPFAKTYVNVTYTIMSNSKHAEAAMRFLNLWFSNAKVADLIKYGIEGTHYQINENGAGDYVDGQDMSSCTYHLSSAINNTVGIRWVTENPDYAKLLEESNQDAKRSMAMGFKFDTTKVTNEITQLDNVCSKYQIGLESGALNPEEYLNAFLEELKNAGIDSVITEKQSQLDAWLE